MVCPVCSKETEIDHESDKCYLTDGHVAQRNPHINLDVLWYGYRNKEHVEMNIKGLELVPDGDMDTSDNWIDPRPKCNQCGALFEVKTTQSRPEGTLVVLVCGCSFMR